MPPRGSLVLGLWTMTGRPTSPTPESVTLAPGGPQPQHLGRQRAEMGLAGRRTPVPGEARPDGRGGGQAPRREDAHIGRQYRRRAR